MAAQAQLALFETPAPAVAATPAADPSRVLNEPTLAPSRRRSQAWLALHLADLSLAAIYNAAAPERRAMLDASAWAVIEDDRLKHVGACNAQAWNCGVRPGHRMNAAIALCNSLVLVSRDVGAETRLLEHVANECFRYTSAVSIQPPNEVLLEVRGSLKLFGGPAAILERIQTDLGVLNAGLQLALAPTARSAQWLARASTTPRICLPRELVESLSSLPIASLHWPLPIELQLTRFGITNVGDLMRLPRKDLARRIGSGPVRELQQAMGRTTWLHRGWATPPSYHDRVLLDFEIETTGLLEKMLERPLARLKRTLIGAERAIDELIITLKHREGATPVVIRLQQPSADMAHITKLLHEHLDRLVLCAPVREVTIDVVTLLAANPSNRSLAMDPATRTDVSTGPELKARLLERLQSRFGVNAIRALAVRAHHVPERAQCSELPLKETTNVAVPARLPRRPLWLLREPKPVSQQFQIASGPETIEAEDWEGVESRPDATKATAGDGIKSRRETIEAAAWGSAAVRRAYYRTRVSSGVECWMFRDLTAPHRWFVHGLFG